jgi:hypothetical protein
MATRENAGRGRLRWRRSGEDELAFTWNQWHDCVHEEPPEKSIAVSETAGTTRDLDDRRSDRKRAFRHPFEMEELAPAAPPLLWKRPGKKTTAKIVR